MPKFNYQAIDNAGQIVKGDAIAADDRELETRLVEKNLTLVSARKQADRFWDKGFLGSRIKQRDIIELYHRLYQTLELGLPMLTALEENASQLPSRKLRNVVDEIRIAIENGNSFAASMSQFPKFFGKLDLAIVRMGEESGVLPKCLKDLSDFLQWMEQIRSTIRRAAIYPCFVVIVIVGVIGVWVGYVLPQLAGLLTQMDVNLPGITKIILNASTFVQNWWHILVLAVILSIIVFFWIYFTKKGRVLIHRYALKIPIIGQVLLNIALARLSNNFATMYQAGISINAIFEILSADVLGNRHLEELLKKAFEAIQQGESIAQAFELAGGFPPLMLGAVKNGENTGTIDQAFKRLGDYYDHQAQRTVQAMISAIEPLSIIMLGGIFGIIVLSILLPLYDVVGKF